MGADVGGALAEEVVVPSSCCYPVGDLSAELAALVEPVSIGLQAVARALGRGGGGPGARAGCWPDRAGGHDLCR